jgi:hypothetical protein
MVNDYLSILGPLLKGPILQTGPGCSTSQPTTNAAAHFTKGCVWASPVRRPVSTADVLTGAADGRPWC